MLQNNKNKIVIFIFKDFFLAVLVATFVCIWSNESTKYLATFAL